jgi:hypothetical protein
VDDAILANAAFLNQIVANPEIFENGGPSESEAEAEEEGDGFGESLSLDESRDEGVQLLASPTICRNLLRIHKRSQHALEMERGALRLITIRTHTHTSTPMITSAHMPMDPTPILPQAKKTRGANAARWTLTWTR